jgi:hypothetical protein
MSASVSAAYRGLLRAVATTFAGDASALAQGRSAAAAAFRGWAPPPAAPAPADALARALADADEAAAFLREHVAQGRLNERGAYEVALKPPGAGGGAAPPRLHLQHARDVEDPAAPAAPGAGGCCGGGCR